MTNFTFTDADGVKRTAPIPLSPGQSTSQNSQSVVLSSDHAAIPVSISNFPTSQMVTISTLPLPSGAATESNQTDGNTVLGNILTRLGQNLNITGTVSVNNFPATQGISAAALPLPTGASTSALQTAGNAVLTGILTALGNPLQGGGAVSVSNFPTTQAISAASLPLPSGAATSTLQSDIKTLLTAIDTTLGNPLQAGGSVSISGTVGISATTLPLPTGAATSVLQSTGNTVLSNILTAIGTPFQSGESLSISNTVDVTGTVSISNPVEVSGIVSVSMSQIPLATNAATSTLQSAGNTTLSEILTTLGNPLQTGGSIAISNFPTTQAITAVNLPLPTGASTEAGQEIANISLNNIDTDLGAATDSPASSDTGIFSLISLIKRGLQNWTSLLTRLPSAPVTTNPQATTSAMPVAQRPVYIWTASFADVGSSLISQKFVQRRLGTGVSVSQSAGNLVVTSGTTPNAEFLARSTESFDGSFINRIRVTLSQRIAQNNFMYTMADRIGETLAYNCISATVVDVTLNAHGFTGVNIGQAMNLGGITVLSGTAVPGRYVIASIPDINTIRFTVAGWASGTGTLDLFGWNYYRTLYNGTTATNVLVDAQRQGWATGDSSTSFNTTASPGHMMQLVTEGRQAYWSDTLLGTVTTPTVVTRGSRYENLPDPEVELFLYIWSFNGTTAPASTTTWTTGFISIENTVNNPVYLAGVRQMGAASPLPVFIPGTVSIGSGTLTTVSNVTTVASITSGNLGIPGLINDVASAAITTSTTTAAFAPTFGSSYEINVPVTVVSGTNPTLDIVVQESDDNGTNWFDVWHISRITASGIYRTPKLPLTGNRVRYAQTVSGTTPSFTRTINRLQSSDTALPMRKIFDRSFTSTQTQNSTSAVLQVFSSARNAQIIISANTISTAPAFQLQGSDDGGVSWYSIGTPLLAVQNSVVQLTINNIYVDQLRAIVTTAGSGATLAYIALKVF